MNKTLEKIWNDYFSAECSTVETDDERRCLKVASEMHERITALLDSEQAQALEEYIAARCDSEEAFMRSAFFKGCAFMLSLLSELTGG